MTNQPIDYAALGRKIIAGLPLPRPNTPDEFRAKAITDFRHNYFLSVQRLERALQIIKNDLGLTIQEMAQRYCFSEYAQADDPDHYVYSYHMIIYENQPDGTLKEIEKAWFVL